MECCPRIYMEDHVKFPVDALTWVMVGIAKKGLRSTSKVKMKYAAVMKISVPNDQPVYLDVLTGELFDDINEMTDTAILNPVNRNRQFNIEENYIGKDQIRQYLSQLKEETKNIFPISYLCDKHMYPKTDGMIQYQLEDRDLIDHIVTPDLIQTLIEDDIYILRDMMQKPHVPTRCLFYGKTKAEEEKIVYLTLLGSYRSEERRVGKEC